MREETLVANCDSVSKVYMSPSGPVEALHEVDLQVPARAVTALIGPSGSGKSSLLRILAALDHPTSGWVQIHDIEISRARTAKLAGIRRKHIGYVFQRPSDNLISYLSVIEHLELAARLRGHAVTGEADELLEWLGLSDRREALPHQLSGGEQQRVAFAQAVIGAPALVLADEPTAELDRASAANLVEKVAKLVELGVGVVVATHDPTMYEASDRRVYIRDGRIDAAP